MPSSLEARLRALAWPTYGIALLLVLTALADVLSNVWPLRPGDVHWRFGAAGLLSGYLLTPLLGLWMAGAAAMILKQRSAGYAVASVALALAALLLVVSVVFSLDAVQVRPRQAPDDAAWTFQVGAIKSAARFLTTAAALVWLAVVTLRVVGRTVEKRAGPSGAEVEPAPLVIGSSITRR